MTFDVQIDGVPVRLEVHRDGDLYRFRLGDQEERQAQLAEVEPGVFSVLLDGRSYEARAEYGDECAWITVRGRRFRVAITDPRRWTQSSAALHGHDRETIVASMPGKIVRVLVLPGETVAAGQGVIVIEAMKMQNELKARRAGRLTAVPVREGETVAAGAILATIE
ncbi:MAG: acetyl-CoA carboxylase biotin carboxyl carrier protein subunit [Acidobacteria bacterium]|nr:MAG: acetyl-CoA carboxylase biotin carboxyl carrier protein subunit [Acidobacteriota bacterium]